MPVPKRKRSRARRDSRFANKGLSLTPFVHCSNCKEAIAGHQACAYCGFYKGKKVMQTKLDRGLQRKEKKAQSKSKAETENQES
jgi:large subunit ribosomal protein L32